MAADGQSRRARCTVARHRGRAAAAGVDSDVALNSRASSRERIQDRERWADADARGDAAQRAEGSKRREQKSAAGSSADGVGQGRAARRDVKLDRRRRGRARGRRRPRYFSRLLRPFPERRRTGTYGRCEAGQANPPSAKLARSRTAGRRNRRARARPQSQAPGSNGTGAPSSPPVPACGNNPPRTHPRDDSRVRTVRTARPRLASATPSSSNPGTAAVPSRALLQRPAAAAGLLLLIEGGGVQRYSAGMAGSQSTQEEAAWRLRCDARASSCLRALAEREQLRSGVLTRSHETTAIWNGRTGTRGGGKESQEMPTSPRRAIGCERARTAHIRVVESCTRRNTVKRRRSCLAYRPTSKGEDHVQEGRQSRGSAHSSGRPIVWTLDSYVPQITIAVGIDGSQVELVDALENKRRYRGNRDDPQGQGRSHLRAN
ncbi:hypothetical protein BDV95DRAFT_596390 [Massariosphaeria phaeospora]|uniref:Uncharacterized protein n=1 Tax=Massariosphaeria phaeospora TaxID=100035 RepID=A0A7C8M5W6_9PLEO|nr:hypothetical protein BDV95DRAFT_596390 [Massariosphaeria phaeospora]